MRFRRTQKQSRNPLFMGEQQEPWLVRHARWSGAIVLFLCAGFLYLIFGLPYWRMTELRVRGEYTLPLTELRAMAVAQQQGRWLLFFRQTNVWAFDTKAFERRLRERWMFSSLKLQRTLPNKVTLTVTEEQPAYIYQSNDRIIGIDRNGIASTVLPAVPSGTVQMVFLEPPVLTLGSAILTGSQASFVSTFVEHIRDRNDDDLVVQKITIAVAPDTTVRFTMQGEWDVVANATGDARAQVDALLLAYDQKLKGEKLEYVDVSVPARVYVK